MHLLVDWMEMSAHLSFIIHAFSGCLDLGLGDMLRSFAGCGFRDSHHTVSRFLTLFMSIPFISSSQYPEESKWITRVASFEPFGRPLLVAICKGAVFIDSEQGRASLSPECRSRFWLGSRRHSQPS